MHKHGRDVSKSRKARGAEEDILSAATARRGGPRRRRGKESPRGKGPTARGREAYQALEGPLGNKYGVY